MTESKKAIYMKPADASLKLDSSHKLDAGLLLPAVKPGG